MSGSMSRMTRASPMMNISLSRRGQGRGTMRLWIMMFECVLLRSVVKERHSLFLDYYPPNTNGYPSRCTYTVHWRHTPRPTTTNSRDLEDGYRIRCAMPYRAVEQDYACCH